VEKSMFVATWRYSTALALVAGALTQPALAHGHFNSTGVRHHHHHDATMRAAVAHRFVSSRMAGRSFAMLETPAADTWSGPSPSFMSTSYEYRAPARRWRHRAVAEAWQANRQSSPQDYWQQDYRQSGWHAQPQQAAWGGENWPQTRWRQSRFAQQENFAASGAEPSYSANYAYESQSSWSQSSEGFGGRPALGGMVAEQASSAGVPLSLAERVIRRESGGSPRAAHAGNYGLMQIRLGTARSMGYGGSARGLLDPAVNMTYAMRYLAGAYRAAGGNESRAVALYARGYRAAPARVQTYMF
jgi:soluble lytic murein transglycosylase-like protein